MGVETNYLLIKRKDNYFLRKGGYSSHAPAHLNQKLCNGNLDHLIDLL